MKFGKDPDDLNVGKVRMIPLAHVLFADSQRNLSFLWYTRWEALFSKRLVESFSSSSYTTASALALCSSTHMLADITFDLE